MKSKIIFTIFTFLTVTVLFLAYDMVQKRYFTPEEATEEPTSLFEEIKKDMAKDTDAFEDDTTSENVGEAGMNIERDKDGNARINKTDCINDCKKFENSKEDYKHCKKLCGFTPVVKKENRSECADLSGNKLDFCLRDLAVTKKDFKICDEISDKMIKDACNNLIIDDIFDEK